LRKPTTAKQEEKEERKKRIFYYRTKRRNGNRVVLRINQGEADGYINGSIEKSNSEIGTNRGRNFCRLIKNSLSCIKHEIIP